tara:strand:- start:1159 stop:1725 length:567 start_codon:yes stop_codon:yes gene_type:complete
MKITNEQIRQIIKEELEAVINESSPLIYGMGLAAAAKRRRAAAKKRRAALEPLPRGGYKRGYGGPSSSSNERDAEIEKIMQQRAAQDAAEEEARQQYARDIDPSLEALGQAKLKAIQALGIDEDGNYPYVYTYSMDGSPENLATYYDGPLNFQDAISLAKDAGELSYDAIDDESGGLSLDELFPGKYI